MMIQKRSPTVVLLLYIVSMLNFSKYIDIWNLVKHLFILKRIFYNSLT